MAAVMVLSQTVWYSDLMGVSMAAVLVLRQEVWYSDQLRSPTGSLL